MELLVFHRMWKADFNKIRFGMEPVNHACYLPPCHLSLMFLTTWAGTAWRISTRLSEIMGQVCNAIPVNIIILLCILDPHHWSLIIFVRMEAESLFPMALFTAVNNALSLVKFFTLPL